jgi:hypothetical protein
MHFLRYGNELDRFYCACVATWSGGSFDTTMGYHSFGANILIPAVVFAWAAMGLRRHRRWGYELANLLAWIGVLEPIVRLATIQMLVPYSDSLGYLVDVEQARLAVLVVSLPSLIAILMLCLPATRQTFGKQWGTWRRYTLANLATATAIFAFLGTHVLNLSQVYGNL